MTDKTQKGTNDSPNPLFLSDVMQLGDDNKLSFPARLLHVVEWATGSNNKNLIADLVEPGHIRFHFHDDLSDRLDDFREELSKADDPESMAKLAVLEDRYRPLTLYKDRRVRLGEALLVFLGITPPERPYLFIQASKRVIDVMNLEIRNRRIMRYRGETTP